MRPMGLRARIITVIVLVTLTATVAMAFTAYKLQESETKERFTLAARAAFNSDVHQAERVVRAQPAKEPLPTVSDYMSGEFGSTWTVINLRNSWQLRNSSVDQKVMAGSPRVFDSLYVHPSLMAGTRHTAIPVSVLDEPWARREQELDSWLVISRLIDGTELLLVEYYSLQPLRDDLSTLRWQLATVAGVVAALGVLAALIAAGRIHRPVRRVAAAAQSVGDGTFDVRVPVHGRDELANLAGSFNSMAQRLQEKDEQQQRFFADVAHDMRTPVAAMVAAADGLQGGNPAIQSRSAELLGAQSRRLARLVEDLLEMSRFDAGVLVLQSERVDLPSMVADAIELTTPDGQVTVHTKGDTVIQGDPRRLHTVVCNLLANAVHHGSEPITVTIDGSKPNVATIEVADSGPGIPAELQPILFDRFIRGDRARRRSEGSGLGLAIARENVLLHHGWISASTQDGAVFTVQLPR